MGMTLTQIEALKKAGKIRDYTVSSTKKPAEPEKGSIPAFVPDLPKIQHQHIVETIQQLCEEFQLSYEEEYKFHSQRKFRFDWAIPQLKIGIEYEGLFSKKSRHTTITGYVADCQKYNLAVLDGWMVLRYTAKNFYEIEPSLRLLITSKL